MNILNNIVNYVEPYIDILRLIAVLLISFIALSIILKLVKRQLLKRVKTKKQISNVTVFLDLLKYLFISLFIVIVFIAYSNSWGEIGFIVGLLTVAIGWALQKPISSIFAWLIIIGRKPFKIGDRVVISGRKGDITDISPTHIFLDEVGGTIDGEENSGRTVMLPTSILFEQEVINYTGHDDYILDEVTTSITYESSLENAEEIICNAVKEVMDPLWKKFPKRIPQEPHIRLKSKASGVDVTVRYYSLVTKRNAIATDITREILKQINKTQDVEVAYPHTEVLFRGKGKQ
ncbi:MAG: mechanosensitive ion channel family protein [Candidatus Thermoplasmatota archaeon]|nr:mechanosensitive ion channel family protein [Candidatus Thermoplasmatota archaeon]